MHREIADWLRQAWHRYPELFNGKRVLECGSRYVGFSSRAMFPMADYTGVDAQEGQGVDVVSLVHEYEPDAPFDVVVCTSMLEHDPYWRQSLAARDPRTVSEFLARRRQSKDRSGKVCSKQ